VKFAVGYQLPDEGEPPFSALVREFSSCVEEVYFPWLDMPSGRSPMASASGFTEAEAEAALMADLAEIRRAGVKLNLLMNASCYGPRAHSRGLQREVLAVVGRLSEAFGLDVVTTMSPFIAGAVKGAFPGIDVRASVNMRLGAESAMECVLDLFDSFHVQRELNRDLARLRELRAWAEERGKRLHILANSGCLAFCPVQTFHDNLVSHEREIDARDSVPSEHPALCWRFYGKRENWAAFLRNTWIRPEDVRRYEGLFPAMKLATRQHSDPRRVIEAYSSGRYAGNLCDLLEPGHARAFAPHVFDNSRFPPDWFERTSACGRRCAGCGYCAAVLDRVLVRTG
jgi:hypothetical protein